LIFTPSLVTLRTMWNEFLAVLLLGAIGAVMGIGMLAVPLIFAPRKPNPVKSEPFECGQIPVGEARVRVVMRYYPYLLMFVVFDIMSIFLYAWAVAYRQYVAAASVPILMFIGILVLALVHGLSLAGRKEFW